MKNWSIRNPLLTIICIFLTWHFMWAVYAFHPPTHARVEVIHAFVWFSGPLLLLAGSMAGLYRRWKSVKIIKRALMLHLLLALLGALVLHVIPYKRDYANPSVLDMLGIYLAVAIVLDAVLLLFLPRSTPAIKAQTKARSVFLTISASIVGVMALLALWSCTTAWIVQWRVAQKAGSLPYCIQVRSYESQYRPVTNLSDISGFQMQGKWNHGATSHGWQDFHAVLIVRWEDDLHYYNWSYLRQNFAPITQRARKNLYLLRPSCEPASHFISTLN